MAAAVKEAKIVSCFMVDSFLFSWFIVFIFVFVFCCVLSHKPFGAHPGRIYGQSALCVDLRLAVLTPSSFLFF